MIAENTSVRIEVKIDAIAIITMFDIEISEKGSEFLVV